MDTPLIAVIDDDTPFREMIDEVLREEGYRMIGCATTSDAIALVARTRPDAVILDLWMETRDAGWQLLERLRRDPRTTCVPVLVCSGDVTSLTKNADWLRRGGYAVLEKPFDLTSLLDSIGAMTASVRTCIR